METSDVKDDRLDQQRKRKSRSPEPSQLAPKRPSIHQQPELALLAGQFDSKPVSVDNILEYGTIQIPSWINRQRQARINASDARAAAEEVHRQAEKERLRNLSPIEALKEATERLEKTGQSFFRGFESSGTTIILQKTSVNHNGGAGCRAKDDCLQRVWVEAKAREMLREDSNLRYGENRYSDRGNIQDQYRIFVHESLYYKHYYHIRCFETMVDLAPLIPDKFFLDTINPCKMGPFELPPSWGLMFRSWFGNKGDIDLERIAAYIDAEKAYWDMKGDSNLENYSPTTARPVLKGHVTAVGGGCSLSDVAQNRSCDLMPNGFRAMYGQSGLNWWIVFPEDEDREVKLEVPENTEEKKAAIVRILFNNFNSAEGDSRAVGGEEGLSGTDVREEGKEPQE